MVDCGEDGGILLQSEFTPLTPEERAQLASATAERVFTITSNSIRQLANGQSAVDGFPRTHTPPPPRLPGRTMLLLADTEAIHRAQESAQRMSDYGLYASDAAHVGVALIVLALVVLLFLVFLRRWQRRRRRHDDDDDTEEIN
jgi:hypothetical protein